MSLDKYKQAMEEERVIRETILDMAKRLEIESDRQKLTIKPSLEIISSYLAYIIDLAEKHGEVMQGKREDFLSYLAEYIRKETLRLLANKDLSRGK